MNRPQQPERPGYEDPPNPGPPSGPGRNGESWPPPSELAKYENAAERRKHILPGVLMVVAGLVSGLLAHTATTMLSHHQGEPTNSAGARTVITKNCEQYGPISRAGLGYWWECTADEVDGSKTVYTSSSELTPADIGKPVEVREEGRSKAYRGGSYQRDVEHPLHGVGIGVAVVGFVTVFALFGNAFMRLVPQSIRLETDKKHAEKLREQYRREGRL